MSSRSGRLSAAGWLMATVLCVSGCGESREPLPVAPAPPPPPPVAAPAPAPVAQPATPPRVPQRNAPVRPTVQEDPPNTYQIVDAAPNFEARLTGLKYGAERYEAVRPKEGVAGNQFVAVRASESLTRAAPNREFRLPEGFTAIPTGGYDALGVPLRIRCERDGAELALVPTGGFLMGKDGASEEVGPAHQVFLDGYYIDVHEVTVGQYLKYRSENIAKRPAQPLNPADPPRMPVVGVPWRDAQNYARWAGKDLPREAEWEKAGRGESGFDYPWGSGRPLWGRSRRPGQIDVVGTHPEDRSIYGVMDLAGGVREWCDDWYAADAYQSHRTPDGSPVRNPEGPSRPSATNARVVKGTGSEGWWLWSRTGLNMKESLPDVGFRCVLRVKLPTPPETASSTGR